MPDSDSEDVSLAVEAAKSAFPDWAATPAAKRAELLQQIADKIEERLEEFAMVKNTSQYNM